MNQLKDRKWTRFQIDAEWEHFGSGRIVDEQNVLCQRIATMEQNHTVVRDMLSSACRIYCEWYDKGKPDWMTGEQCAYEMVSAIRGALSKLNDLRK